jgi:hypothetical protein
VREMLTSLGEEDKQKAGDACAFRLGFSETCSPNTTEINSD